VEELRRVGEVVALIALLAVPAGALKLAAPGLQSANVKPEVATFCNDHLGHELNERGIRVVSPSEIGAVLGVERQKQLLGCTDDSSTCLTELAGALGADAVIVGSIARFGESYQLDVKVVSSKDASVLASHSVRIAGDDAMLDALSATAKALALQLKGPGGDAPVSTQKVAGFAIGGVGLAAAIVGGCLLGPVFGARSQIQGLAPTQQNVPAAMQFASSGTTFEIASAVLLGVGAAGVATGLVLLLTGSTSATVVAVPVRSGGFFALSGSLP
jgi:hypothetical protein